MAITLNEETKNWYYREFIEDVFDIIDNDGTIDDIKLYLNKNWK